MTPLKRPPVRAARRARREDFHFQTPLEGGDSEGSWAVSYADLLMVLMSFFIIFFSFDSDKAIDALKISKQLQTGRMAEVSKALEPVTVERSPASKDSASAPNSFPRSDIYAKLQSSLDLKKVSLEQSRNAIVIDLPDNIFGNKEYRANAKVAAALRTVLSALGRFRKDIKITFIGHSDTAKVHARDKILTNNFVLSALRATHALEYAIQKQFPSEHLFAQGDAFNSRKSRSLSVKVQLLSDGDQ